MMTFRKNNAGFTVVEAVASTFILSLIVIALTSVFVFFLYAQRKAINTQVVIENTNYIMESLAKEIRMAEEITSPLADGCVQPTSGVPLQILFRKNESAYGMGSPPPGQEGHISYYLSAGNVIRRVSRSRGTGIMVEGSLNSDEVVFTDFRICLEGLDASEQPRVTVSAKIRSAKDPSYLFNIQSTVSMRNQQ